MALVASALKSAIMDAVDGKTDGAVANTALGNALADYIKNNCIVTLSWNGTNPGPPPTSDPANGPQQGQIVSCAITLTPSGATSQSAAMTAFGTQIQTGVIATVYNMPPGWSTSSGTFSTIGPLSLSISGNDRDVALQALADGIINWLKAYVPVIPCSGSHGAYIGVGTPTGIS